MWTLTIKNPDSEPVQIKLQPGKMVVGRNVTSDIVITDAAASRRHAEIYLDSLSEVAMIIDLKSSNGTYVNRQRISGMLRLQNNDVIRIGQTVMHLTKIANVADQKGSTGTRLFTRELVLEAVDEHPMLLYEMVQKLNTVLDIDSAIGQITELVKRAMGVDICEILLAKDFKKINQEKKDDIRVRVIRNSSVEMQPNALCMPIVSDGKPLGLIYLEKLRQGAVPFDERDMQLAAAISHQTALTLERMELLEKVRKDEQIKQLLLRFVSPIEADYILKDYLTTGSLPGLAERKVTVLVVEIADAAELANRIGPKYFSSILNRFYQYSTKVVFKKGGVVKYLGDGLIAVFIEAKDKPSPEERAVGAGLEIIAYVKAMGSEEPDQACDIGIAINTGKAMVGYVGTQERAEFNVMGDLIKITSRMQELARPNRIFVGQKTIEPLINRFQVKKMDDLAMPGKEKTIQVYEITLVKTAPFVEAEIEAKEEEDEKDENQEKEQRASPSFRDVAQRLKAHLDDRD